MHMTSSTIQINQIKTDTANDNDGQLSAPSVDCYLYHGILSIFHSFISELSFMPSVIIATICVVCNRNKNDMNYNNVNHVDHNNNYPDNFMDAEIIDPRDESFIDNPTDSGLKQYNSTQYLRNMDDELIFNGCHESYNTDKISGTQLPSLHSFFGLGELNHEIQYGLLISCINFGDQIGDWIAVPITSALGISRENQWHNLDMFQVICTVYSLVSLSFLILLRTPSSHENYRSFRENFSII